MRKILFLIAILSVFSISLIGQSIVVTPTYSHFSFGDLAAPAIIATEVHREVENRINNLKLYITDALSKDIDDELRSELNNDYIRIKQLSENLNRNGISQSIINEFNSIYNDTNSHIISYNNRVAQRQREYEREQKRIAEEQKRISEEQERQRIIEESKPQIWSGTGFALNKGYLVTNWHVAEGAQTIYIYGVRGDFTKKYIADVIAKDKITDIAILRISGNGFPGFGTVPYKIRTSTAEVAEEVFALGYPLTEIMGDEVKYTDGKISALSGFDGNVSMYQISAPIQNGNSGGPVFDDNGNVIGIACAGIDNRVAQNANYAVKASYLKSLADAMQIANVMPTSSQMANYTRRQDKVKAVKNFVFYIECYNKEMPLEGVANRPSYINVSPTSLSFSEKQESKTLTITTNAPSWKISSIPDWCTASNMTSTTITINVTMIDSTISRNGIILLEASDGKMVSISVTQSYEYIDLGLPSGTLWKKWNESDSFYTYDQAVSKYGSKLPTKEQMGELKNSCRWTWTGDGYNVTGPNGNSIFLPAVGHRDCDGSMLNVGKSARYWLSTPRDSDDAWFLYFSSGIVGMDYNYWCNGHSVRLVCAQ